MRALPGNSDAERRVHLDRYVQTWLTGRALTVGDILLRADVRKALLTDLREDLRFFFKMRGGAVAAHLAGEVMEFLGGGIAKLLGLGGR